MLMWYQCIELFKLWIVFLSLFLVFGFWLLTEMYAATMIITYPSSHHRVGCIRWNMPSRQHLRLQV